MISQAISNAKAKRAYKKAHQPPKENKQKKEKKSNSGKQDVDLNQEIKENDFFDHAKDTDVDHTKEEKSETKNDTSNLEENKSTEDETRENKYGFTLVPTNDEKESESNKEIDKDNNRSQKEAQEIKKPIIEE